MKHKFTIVIEETVTEEFEVFAKNKEEALLKAEENYKKGKFVLEPGNVRFRHMAITKPTNIAVEWCNF